MTGREHDEWCVGRHDEVGTCLNVYQPGREHEPHTCTGGDPACVPCLRAQGMGREQRPHHVLAGLDFDGPCAENCPHPDHAPGREQTPDYDTQVREHLDREAERARPFCGEWPFAASDLDLVLPEQNDAVHRARGCCDGPSASARES